MHDNGVLEELNSCPEMSPNELEVVLAIASLQSVILRKYAEKKPAKKYRGGKVCLPNKESIPLVDIKQYEVVAGKREVPIDSYRYMAQAVRVAKTFVSASVYARTFSGERHLVWPRR